MAVKYQSIVFMQGDDANEPLDALYNHESDDSIVYHGPTAESIAAAFAYLRQWDYGEPAEETLEPSSGSSDDTWEQDGYRLSAHLGMGIGLERVIVLPVESYRCPCCGDDVMSERPVCGDCRTAGCERTMDACGEPGYWECQVPTVDKLADRADEIGAAHGRNAASWVIDGSTSREACERLVKGLEDGDPMVMDAYNPPNLSGEFADGYAPTALAHDLGIDAADDDINDYCEAWETAASESFWTEVERIARGQLS